MPLHLATRDASPRKGFTLTELLVVVAIILVLMSLIGAGVSNVRASQKRTTTQDLIQKLDAIVMRQFRTYDNRSVPALILSSTVVATPLNDVFKKQSEKRAWYIRRNILSGELPDRWTDVSVMATLSASGKWSPTPIQKTFINIWNNVPNPPPAQLDQYAGAECLFMIVMQSGMADPIELRNLGPINDKDGDGLMEFWDAWGNPIGYILWPYAVQLPGGSGQQFFSGARAPVSVLCEAAASPSATLGMRPLIYSAGPDGDYAFDRSSEAGNLANDTTGASCGDWTQSPTSTSARPTSSLANDNITNFDDEAKR